MQRSDNWIRQRPEDPVTNDGLLRAIMRGIFSFLASADRLMPAVIESISGPLSIVIICLLAITDFLLVPPLHFSLFYLMLVVFATWTSGRKTGLVVTTVSLLALFVDELQRSPGHSLNWPLGWNLVLQISIYLFTALSVSSVRDWIRELEQRARDRTAALELEVEERKQTEEQLRKTAQQLRQLAENITDAFWMRNAGDPRMVYVSPAYEKIWGRNCRDLYPSVSGWLDAVHPEDRDRVAQAFVNQSSGEHSEEYRIVRPDGTLRWIRDRAFPIRNSAGAVIRIVGIAEDITDRRRLEYEILEISDREQARLGQDLHDSLCQKLVSAAFDNNALKRRLANQELPEANQVVQQVGAVLDDAITEARTLARGLFPVQLEVDGLHVALQQLAASIHSRFHVQCEAHCDESIAVPDNAFATHLYRIAQEAATNAAKHAKAALISVELNHSGGFIELKITDNGIGITLPLSGKGGMGLHTMEYRARTIGGTLNIAPAPTHGTIISCRVPQRPI
jgi:PAS domain S-box-containing protein